MRAEVHEDSKLETGGVQIVKHLGVMAIVQPVERFDLDEDSLEANKIGAVDLL